LQYRRRVAWADTDASGAWTFHAALRYVEEAEVELLRDASVLHDLYGSLPRIYIEAQYLRAAHFDDEVEVKLTLRRVGSSSLHYDFTLLIDGTPSAEGRMGSVFVGDDGRSTPLPEPVRNRLERWSADGSTGT
jgi:acyl-CoA thioester hydrolase